MKGASNDDTKVGVVHAGPTAIDDLLDLIRAMGEGWAFVLADADGAAAARTYVQRAFTQAGMPARIVELPPGARLAIEIFRIAADLAGSAGGALFTNPLRRAGQPLLAGPRAHLAVPTALGPAERSTSLVTLDRHAEPFEDDRVSALSVIDDRVFPDTAPDMGHYKLLAVVLAACIVTDDTATLRASTLALSAVHRLVHAQLRPVDVRQALALSVAGHRRWPLCPRCQAGIVLPTATLEHTAHSPAGMCLQEAVARGLSEVSTWTMRYIDNGTGEPTPRPAPASP
jgi:hypothetical protein